MPLSTATPGFAPCRRLLQLAPAEPAREPSNIHLRVEGMADWLTAKVGAVHRRVDTGQAVDLALDLNGAPASSATARRLG